MKFAIVASALLAVVYAANKPIKVEFTPSCSDSASACTGDAKCCEFKDANAFNKLKQCMTSAKRTTWGGGDTGSYTDDQGVKFTWTCPADPKPAAKTGAYAISATLSAGAVTAAYFLA